jgi:UDP-N-acetyl-D-galactosamine dehydrogenase
MRADLEDAVVCVIGLGYVGLPLAEAFSRSLKVISFDIDQEKLGKLRQSANNGNLIFTDNPREIGRADFIIICVPTPLTKSREPDLSYVEGAARLSGRGMKRGSTVILESTVYPGVTEDIVRPILEESSGLRCGRDFKIGYSPERVNPGDTEHTIGRVTKVVSGMDEATTDALARLYRRVTPHIFRARDIKTAEAAKVIENIQRDLNIALMNELALIFERMGLSIREVIEAAATKWNFHRYQPGLVGGHCIPVDPYYLVYRAEELGYHPRVILAGRAINDYMPRHIAEMTVSALKYVGRQIKGARVLIMGLTYKENVADTRETPVAGIIRGLGEYGVEVFGYDPLLDTIEDEFGIRAVTRLNEVGVDGIILAVVHDAFKRLTLDELRVVMGDRPVLIDVRGFFDREEAEGKGIYYRQL